MTKVSKSPGTSKPKDKYRVKNWAEYNRGLKNRGTLTLWIEDGLADKWFYAGKRSPGGKVAYSDTAIELFQVVRSVFGLPLRQAEGFLGSLLALAGMAGLKVPSYTQVCRRLARLDVKFTPRPGGTYHVAVDSTGLKVFGEGEWKVRKHGHGKRRTWRKLHIGVDSQAGEVTCVLLTGNDVTDDDAFVEMAGQWPEGKRPEKASLDGAYDKKKVYDLCGSMGIEPAIPPREGAVLWHGEDGEPLDHPRNEAVAMRAEGRLDEWKAVTGYHRRSLSETFMYRYKTTFGERMASRKFENQSTEAKINCKILNRFIAIGKPVSEKIG